MVTSEIANEWANHTVSRGFGQLGRRGLLCHIESTAKGGIVGGVGSGNKGANRGMVYNTARRRRELALWEQEQAEQKEARRAAAKERARLRRNARYAERRAAGMPATKGGAEKPGSSTPRWRRWFERQRAKRAAAAEEAKLAHKAQLAAIRKAKGLERIRTRAEIQANYRARKQAELLTYWFSPALSEKDAKAVLRGSHPSLNESQIHDAYVHLLTCANLLDLNVNHFTIAQDGVDGLQRARQQRAIFYECQQAAGATDLLAVLEQTKGVTSLETLPKFQALNSNECRMKNALRDSLDFSLRMWGRGDLIYKAVAEAK